MFIHIFFDFWGFRSRIINRPNRFIAHVLVDGKEEVVHVKNTGRCREILTEGAEVILEDAQNKDRKTKYSLIAAYKGVRILAYDAVVYEDEISIGNPVVVRI